MVGSVGTAMPSEPRYGISARKASASLRPSAFAVLAATSFGKAIWPISAAAMMNGETPISSANDLKVNPLARMAFTQARLSALRSPARSDMTNSCRLFTDCKEVRTGYGPVPANRALIGLFELCGLLRALGRVARGVGMRADAGELSLVHHEILGADRLACEMCFEDLARASGIAGLGGEGTARDMRGHTVMRHGAPRMVLRRRLRKPDVAGISRELTALQRTHDGVTVADLATRGVHDIAAALHHADQFVVEHVLGLGMQRCVDRYHVADLDQRFDVRMEGQPELLLHLLRQAMLVIVVELDVERLQTAKRRETYAAGSDGADIHALDVLGALDAVGDVPAALDHPAASRKVVAHQRQDHHDDVLGHADRIAVSDLGDGDALVHRRLQIGVI